MQETQFFQRLLAVASLWFVADVKRDPEARQVDVFVEHIEGISFRFPACFPADSAYVHTGNLSRRHLDAMSFPPLLHARVLLIGSPAHAAKAVIALCFEEQTLRYPVRTFRRGCLA